MRQAHQRQRRADEVQAAAGAVAVLAEVERVELGEGLERLCGSVAGGGRRDGRSSRSPSDRAARSGIQHRVGRLGHQGMPGRAASTTSRLQRGGESPACLRRRHLVARAEHEAHRAAHRAPRRRRPSRIAVAGAEVGAGTGWRSRLRAPARAASARGWRRAARCRGPGTRAWRRSVEMREGVDHVDRASAAASRAVVEQRRRHLHRVGGADHHQARRRARGARAAASSAISEPMLWPTSAACSHAGGIEQRRAASRRSAFDAGQRRRRRCGRGPAGRAPARSQPWWANQRACRVQTLWSLQRAVDERRTVGLAASKGLPPV